ncbi:MAG: methionine biosynthesis protein MetW [Candidatus Vecturithrix sp.]|jgi:hypothetical protein|nr:methionine biosynthesis protein MetW [Candidatus Vecturithrix sp.]
MQFDPKMAQYLNGTLFSNGLVFDIAIKSSEFYDRITILEQMVSNKKVIHLGCCDHIPLIHNKILSGSWLHARLYQKSSRCMGIDMNLEGIQYLKENLHYGDVVCADLIKDEVSQITSNHWDYLVMGEVLEHIDNPVLFLRTIREKYVQYIDKIIITVPNAFFWKNFKYALSHKECINTDHRYWFTPFTLAKIATCANFIVEEFQLCSFNPEKTTWKSYLNVKWNFRYFLLRRFPALRECLIMVLKSNYE